jgi:hypothetical protein
MIPGILKKRLSDPQVLEFQVTIYSIQSGQAYINVLNINFDIDNCLIFN